PPAPPPRLPRSLHDALPICSGLQQLHHLLAHLAAHGVSLRLDPLYARRQPEKIDWDPAAVRPSARPVLGRVKLATGAPEMRLSRSEEHTSELQSRCHLVCRP